MLQRILASLGLGSLDVNVEDTVTRNQVTGI